MGLLDELKKEAEKKEQLEREQGEEREAQQAFYDTQLRPVLRRAHDYLLELVDTLNTVAPDVTASFCLDPEQKQTFSMKQGTYTFRGGDYDKPLELVVSSECRLAKSPEYYVRSKAAVSRYAALLDSHKFSYHSRNELDSAHEICGATFKLEGPLKVQIRLLASPADRCIYVDLLNLESQPMKRYKFPPEKVDDALLDRLARMLVREESVLVEVKISEDTREALRQKLAEQKRRLDEEQARADAAAEAERLAEEESGLLGRARRSMSGGIKKIFSKDS